MAESGIQLFKKNNYRRDQREEKKMVRKSLKKSESSREQFWEREREKMYKKGSVGRSFGHNN